MPILAERKSAFTYVGLEEDDLEPLYCPYCSKVNVYVVLQQRVYEDKELPHDAEEWLQCYRCGKPIHINIGKEEGEYAPIVDIVDNPFDSGSEFMSVSKRKTKKHKSHFTSTQNKLVAKEIAGEKGDINIITGDN